MENQTHTLLPSPSSSSTSSNTAIAAKTPKQQFPLTRSETNPYPTTFVQADTSSFKQVVQMLTGSSEPTPSKHNNNNIPPIKTPTKSKPSKLYERRSTTLKSLRLCNPIFSPNRNNNAEILSPSLLDFPSLVLSPVTPLIHDPFNRSPISSSASPSPNVVVDKVAEDKAIAEKGFFLHPSPVSTPRDSEPRLLPLFPVSSPRVSSGSHSTS
ncbi:VQ motif-containing protein 4-like [Chenopodium quinoa]|uniref:VQ motif-containing protein 4-like n=1 Tax=Chenopodium quinoa TaxID=63459 RepID=UPI000B7803CC|nr:VQ motif-containing protein 4-like [Chenopodium quinoa]